MSVEVSVSMFLLSFICEITIALSMAVSTGPLRKLCFLMTQFKADYLWFDLGMGPDSRKYMTVSNKDVDHHAK